MKKLFKKPYKPGLLFLLIFACLGCIKENNMGTIAHETDHDTTTTPAVAVAGLHYLALGDSYTIGQGVQENQRFPAQTVRLLAEQHVGIQSVTYIATTGWMTGDLIDAIESKKLTANFDLVTLLIGVNDQYQQRDTTGYRPRFTALLNTALTLTANRPKRVFVISIPDYSVTPFVSPVEKARVRDEIEAFNAINRQVTQQYNIAYIDITAVSREAASDLSLLVNDGLHPSGKQYAKWASLIAPAIRNGIN